MKLVTYRLSGAEHVGALTADGKGVLPLPAADMNTLIETMTPADLRSAAAAAERGGAVPLSDVELLAPIPRPRQDVVCLGMNYRDHAEESARYSADAFGQMFSAEDADLMVGIATNSAIACFNAAEDKDIPVIFTAITDPVGAHLDAGNITGTSDALPVEGQLQLIRALQPDADTIGIVYTTSEANSVYSISVYEELATDYGFTIDAVGVTSQAEVTQAVDTLLSHGVDCLSNLTDNNVVGVLGAILEKTDEAGIPVYGSEVEQVKLGCVGGAGLDYIQLGIQTGLMAAKVLTGEAACEDLPYETIENYGLYINSDAAAELGITIPDDIAQEAQECAE